MRHSSLASLIGASLIILGSAVASGQVGAQDDGRPTGVARPDRHGPVSGGFAVEVLVGGRPLEPCNMGGRCYVEAVEGAEYQLRLTNPLPERVAVAVSVDGLNTIDARRTSAREASKWVIRPHDTLTLSGWQVGPERARRFYFTTERDSYAARLGTSTADVGVITAAFFRERQAVAPITRPPTAMQREARDVAGAEATPSEGGEPRRERAMDHRFRGGRAATGLGDPVRHEVEEVAMELERHPVAEVTIRYRYRPASWHPGELPRYAPEPEEPRRREGDRGEDRRFSPEP
jgi:hypothetical protein